MVKTELQLVEPITTPQDLSFIQYQTNIKCRKKAFDHP